MKNKLFVAILSCVLACLSCTSQYENSRKIAGYDLSKPDIFALPDTLLEISGLTGIDSTSFACVQDENGILYTYSTIQNKIVKQIRFSIDGDYEDVARVGDNMYVLRSDGVLFEIKDFKTDKFKTTFYSTGVPCNDNEGLCYDKDNNRLLIACKGQIGEDLKNKDKRFVFEFDLSKKQLNPSPLFIFNIQSVKQFAVDNNLDLPMKSKKKGKWSEPFVRFTTSAIAIHPVTKNIYLLSSADHLLFVTDPKGNLLHIIQLDPVLFNQPEGIMFNENSDMLITNEGQLGKATLLRFNYNS